MAPEVANSLRSLIDSRNTGGDVSDTGLTFAASRPFFEGGENIEVTTHNLDRFVICCREFYMHGQVASKMDAFERGFRKWGSLGGQTPAQLALRVTGEKVSDWKAFQSAATYGGCNARTPAVRWFWEVFWGRSEAAKKQLLLFVTGNDAVPVGGLGLAGIRIDATTNVRNLPFAHVCSKSLSLPLYSSKADLRDKLMIALENPIGFGAA
jgi:hypothetical protein